MAKRRKADKHVRTRWVQGIVVFVFGCGAGVVGIQDEPHNYPLVVLGTGLMLLASGIVPWDKLIDALARFWPWPKHPPEPEE